MKPRHRLASLAALLLATLATASAFAAPAAAILPNVTLVASEVIALWPSAAPGETGTLGPEHVIPNRPRPFDQITDVSIPTLSVFLPAPETRNGTAMLVIPGGGLQRLAVEHEGYEVAEWLNARGIAAFILKYRVPFRDPAQRWKVGLQDAQRAMSLIRSRAAQWQIDPEAIGSIGFSAGAEIDLMLSVYHAPDDRQYPPIDDADTFSTRPAFNIAIYGGGFADVRNNALRADISSRIGKSTPPMFVVHAFDDGALSSVILMNALKRANVASELHIFGAGGHGFGVRDTGLPVGHWRDLCLNWLSWQGFLDSPAVPAYTRAFLRARDHNAAPLPRFSAAHGTATLADAFAVQRRIVRNAVAHGAEIAGYKGALTSAAAQSTFGVGQPVHGVLFKSGRIDASPTLSIPLDPASPVLIETEIGYVMAVDIGSKLTVPRQAVSTVEAIVPVIELPASLAARMDGELTALDLVAANAASHRYIVGAPVAPASIESTDALGVTLERDGRTLHETTGADIVGGQARHLMNLINQIIDQGHVIHGGDLIVSGALGRAHAGESGRYRANFGALGEITFELR